MPSGLSNLDTQFPNFTGQENAEQKITRVQNYLFMLLEELRWTLRNLDSENFNEAGMNEIAQLITKPLMIRIEDDEGQIAQIQIDASGLATRVSNAEGDISALQQTAQSLTSAIGAAQGNISVLQQTVGTLTFSIVQNGNIVTYSLSATDEGGASFVITSTRNIELYSLDGLLPPVGKNAQDVIINANGQSVLEHGWYDTWGNWDGQAVYCCSSYNGGTSWGSVLLKQGVKGDSGTDGVTVMLNNNPCVFPGSTNAALAGSATVGVLAFLGGTRKAATIGTITGQVTGLTTAIQDNGTQNARFVATVTTALTTQSGTLTVPITVEGQTYNLLWSWSVAYKGEQGAQGPQGPQGSAANVTFDNINNALAALFVKISSGTPTQVTDYKIYSPIIEAADIRASNFYAGQGSGYASMAANGFEVMNASAAKKIALGLTAGSNYDVPYLILGAGSDSAGNDRGLVQKFVNGLWIGESAAIGQETSPVSGTGIFIDFVNDRIYKYINGTATELGVAVFS